MAVVRYAFAVILVIALPPALVWWFIVHPFVGFWRRVGARTTVGLMLALSLSTGVILYQWKDVMVGADLGTHAVPVGFALVLGIGSVWIAVKRRRYLTFRILTGLPELQADGKGGKLLSEGPYAVIRHPRYVEFALGSLAYALFANYVGAYVVAFATLPILHGIVLLEERELAARFGREYDAYRQRVPRYIPRF